MLVTDKHVAARNAVNARADLIELMLRDAIRPLIGKKVWKISGHGGPSAALSRAVDAVAEVERLNQSGSHWHLIIHSHVSWLSADLSIWQDGSGRTTETLHLGRRDPDGLLTEVDEAPGHRPQFTLAQVEATRARAYELQREARELLSSVRCFDR